MSLSDDTFGEDEVRVCRLTGPEKLAHGSGGSGGQQGKR
jgi:hypothetical protein